jgi:CheY-like chemotaxis protein
MRARLGALRLAESQPVRIFSVTGSFTALAVASSIRAAWTELARNQPDAILLDINMPDMDGFEVCRRLKMMPETAQIPIVHVTNAYKNEEARQKSLTSGAAEYLMHPVDSDTLFSLLDRLIHGRAATDAATNSSEPQAQIKAS